MNKLATLVVLAFLTAACTKNTEEEKNVIKIDQSALSFTLKEGTADVSIDGNYAWTVVSSDDWCSVSPSSGTSSGSLTVKVVENDTPTERNATVTLKCGDAALQTISVKQSGVTGQMLKSLVGVYTSNGTVIQDTLNKYFYDNQKRLIKVVYPTAYESWGSETRFTYDAQSGDLTQIIMIGGYWSKDDQTIYTYNKKVGSMVTGIITYTSDHAIPGTFKIKLNSSGLMENIEFWYEHYYSKQCYYYEDGNLAKIENYEQVYPEEPLVLNEIETFRYDDKKSPYTTAQIPEWWFNCPTLLSKNNIVYEEHPRSRTLSYQFEYDGCNYPKYWWMGDDTEKLQHIYVYTKW